MTARERALSIRGLRVAIPTERGVVLALDGVDLDVWRHETLGLVGESGCGKSITALSVMRLLPESGIAEGSIALDVEGAARDLLALDEGEMERVRGNDVSMIFQEPMSALNPVLRVGEQVAEAILRHQNLGLAPLGALERALEARGRAWTKRLRERRRRAAKAAIVMLGRTGIPDPESAARAFPHELSGGMRQRVVIAMALACRPRLLIADEPTTSLDVTIQAQILALMRDLQREEDASILLITHHLGVVAQTCDRVAVMYAGQLVEVAPTRDLFGRPAHPYTLGLLRCVPRLDDDRREDLPVIAGVVPDLISPPSGCRFHPRCAWAMDVCRSQKPPTIRIGEERGVACHLYDGTHEVPTELRRDVVGVGGAT